MTVAKHMESERTGEQSEADVSQVACRYRFCRILNGCDQLAKEQVLVEYLQWRRMRDEECEWVMWNLESLGGTLSAPTMQALRELYEKFPSTSYSELPADSASHLRSWIEAEHAGLLKQEPKV